MITLVKRLLSKLRPVVLKDSHAVRPELNELAITINAIANRINHYESDGVNEITAFFQAVATVQDSYRIRPAIQELRQAEHSELAVLLEELHLHITNAGRQEHGMNRTTIGQPVTDADVFLGNIDGYWTKSVAYIKAHKDDHDFYSAVNRQAVGFMQNHVGRMIRLIHQFDQAMGPKSV